MRFRDSTLQGALAEWRSRTDTNERSCADNFWFEERVSPDRVSAFEAHAAGSATPEALRSAHTDYWQTYVKVDEEIAQTFLNDLAPADLGPIDDYQRLVRLEDLRGPIRNLGIKFEDLDGAVRSGEVAVIDKFLDSWNQRGLRDWRPAFATFEDAVLDDLDHDDWPERLRERLGLAHFNPTDGPVPVGLMEYSVADVTRAAREAEMVVAAPFCTLTTPCVLDSGPWPYFFPAPPALACGRTMSLYEVDDDSHLVPEVLHFRVTYRREHLTRLGQITRPLAVSDLRSLRNHHLTAVRLASRQYDYGEEIA